MEDILKTITPTTLKLAEPWYIDRMDLCLLEKELHVWVAVRDDAVFRFPECGGRTVRYGSERDERTWRHIDTQDFMTYIHCQRPRVRCAETGRVYQISAPFEMKGSHFTLTFEGLLIRFMMDMPRKKVAAHMRCGALALMLILFHHVVKAVMALNLAGVTVIAMDETSIKKGHTYVSIFTDATKKRVIWAEEGNGKEAVKRFREAFLEHGGDPDAVEWVTCDMSPAYANGSAECLQNALVVIDKFHVKLVLLVALDKIRRREQSKSAKKRALYSMRLVLMKKYGDLSEEEKERLRSCLGEYLETAKAYELVCALDDFYRLTSHEEAEAILPELVGKMRDSRLKPMDRAANTLEKHAKEILNYFKKRPTNAISEGINSTIQAARKMARGYNSFKGYMAMIFLVAGKLEFDLPMPF